MNIQIENVGPCRKQIKIEFPADKVSTAFKEVAANYARYARIDGFRPGKAPVDLVKRRYAKEIVKDVKEHLIPEGYQAALAKEKLKTVQVVDVTEVDPKDGEPFGFDVTVDTYPEFTLPDYKAIKVEEQPVEVTEESIDEVVGRMREGMGTYEDAPGRKAQASDRVTVTYSATVDGQPMEPLVGEHTVLAKAENFGVILDPNYSFIPEFVEGLTGSGEGDAKEIAVSFDEKFSIPGLAGKKAVYQVNVHKVQKKNLPEMTPEVLKTLGADTVEQLRERIRVDLKRMKQDQERRRVQDAICRNLLENTVMNLPESELQRRTADEVYDLVQYNTERGINRGDIEQNREKIFEMAGKAAEEKLKLRYVLLRIAAEEKVTVTEPEIEARIRLMAMQSNKDPAKLKKEIVQNNRVGMLRDDMLAAKTLEKLESMQKPAATAA